MTGGERLDDVRAGLPEWQRHILDGRVTVEISAVDRVSPVLEAAAERMRRYGEAYSVVDETHHWSRAVAERHAAIVEQWRRLEVCTHAVVDAASAVEWLAALGGAAPGGEYRTVSGALEGEWADAAAAAVGRIAAHLDNLSSGFRHVSGNGAWQR